METPEEIARKKLANMRTPVYNEGSPLANAQGKMNDVAASGMKPIATMADTLATNTGAKAVVNGIGSFMAPAVNRIASDRQANIQAQNAWQQTRSPQVAAAGEAARERLRFVTPFNPVQEQSSTASTTPQQQIAQPKAAVQSQFNWPAHQQVNGSFTDAQGNTSSVNSTAREALNGMNSGNGIDRGFTPNPNQEYTKNPNGSFTTNSGLNVQFDSSVPADRRQAFLANPGKGPVQTDWRDNKSTTLSPVSSSSSSVREPSLPEYITVEKAREMGLGRKAMAAMNANIANDRNAAMSSFTQRDTARTQADASQNNAATNANASLQGHQVAGQSAQEIARMNLTSPVNQAQAGNYNAQTAFHQQQAEQAKAENELNRELMNPETPQARRQQILAAKGKAGQTVRYPTGQYDENGKPIEMPGIVQPGSDTITPLQIPGQGGQGQNSMDDIFNARPDFKNAYDEASPEKKKLMMQQLQQRMAGQR